ncbi:hypothetical protein [Candidatus Parabeggiatoa sp. HSG14]|uniref:hypothetical protein n=1 Tax=Candidatus Parabeggiatoa sp. HSG14 TaxID=3055593 RepID=UPI0025A6966D|nr:hypothetical protein [Thiotrichales bacterium HSG14]
MKNTIQLVSYLLLVSMVIFPSLSVAACGNAASDDVVPDEYLAICLDGVAPFSFTLACERHDKCYDDCQYTHTNHKRSCDEIFHGNLISQCPTRYECIVPGTIACVVLARLYKLGVAIFGHSAYRNAQEKCVDNWWDHFSLETIDWEKIGQEMGEGINQELLNMLKSIDWTQYKQQTVQGFKTELKMAMDAIYEQKITPLLDDMKILLEVRKMQLTNRTAEHLEQFDKILEAKLQKTDDLVQAMFNQYQDISQQTIAKIKTDIFAYASGKFDKLSKETQQKIKTDIIQYASNSFNRVTHKAASKFKADIIDATSLQLQKLQKKLQQDSNDFFLQTKALAHLIDCTQKKWLGDIDFLFNRMTNNPANLNQTVLKACYQTLSLEKTPESFEYTTWYNLDKCYHLKLLTSKTRVATYANLQKQAAKMICHSSDMPDMPSNYLWDWVEFNHHHQFWLNNR